MGWDDDSGDWKLRRAVVGVNAASFVSMPLETIERDELAAITLCCPPFVGQMTVKRPHSDVVNPLWL